VFFVSRDPAHNVPGAHKAATTHEGQRQWSRRSLGIGATAAAVGLLVPWRLAPAAASGASLSPPNIPDFNRPPEGYAQYDGQSTCSPSAKPGVDDFMDLVLAAYPSTGNLGISRDCGIGGTSEHKEGRAWDWAVSAYSQSAIADNLLADEALTEFKRRLLS
jgi:hypothetical protein